MTAAGGPVGPRTRGPSRRRAAGPPGPHLGRDQEDRRGVHALAPPRQAEAVGAATPGTAPGSRLGRRQVRGPLRGRRPQEHLHPARAVFFDLAFRRVQERREGLNALRRLPGPEAPGWCLLRHQPPLRKTTGPSSRRGAGGRPRLRAVFVGRGWTRGRPRWRHMLTNSPPWTIRGRHERREHPGRARGLAGPALVFGTLTFGTPGSRYRSDDPSRAARKRLVVDPVAGPWVGRAYTGTSPTGCRLTRSFGGSTPTRRSRPAQVPQPSLDTRRRSASSSTPTRATGGAAVRGDRDGVGVE